MTDDQRHRIPSILGSALLLAFALGGLWLATWVVVPSALYFVRLYGTEVPSYFRWAFDIYDVPLHAVRPLAVVGAMLFIFALLGRKMLRMSAFARPALTTLAVTVSCLTIYLLGSGGLAYKLASSDQLREIKFYKRTLEDFALLESAAGRFNQVNEAFKKNRDLKMVEVKGASDFNDSEARERINSLVAALPKVKDAAMKKRLLATLSLFRDRVRKDLYSARDIPRHAHEVGAPPMESHAEALEWISSNLNKDGWEPIPLFKLGR